ncbi:aromatic prenyltransferase [Lentithecium fluviatile CBS 122367]|uniref:Aromatic prenyltransferase n=1 Tax=Lentithecium fluviatile CBS 122367 TaxID=1168545 RepID=A0A6G1IER6_9PLEO|nr:aromatic prenyltransferase [Lentithecium fluviatile CBS 122367]
MLLEANYPDEVQRHFLSYYRDTICAQLGPRPDSNSAKSGVGWDGTPLEYSWELKGSTKSQAVRFVVDLSPLHPADNENPLSMETTQKVVDAMAAKTPGFDDTWVRSLKKWFVYSHLPAEEQKALVKKSGQQTSVILGFDIYPRISAPGGLPVMAKVYFPPCYAAAAKNITRWQAVFQGIQQLPDINSYPNILKSLAVINDFLADKPKEWQSGVRYLATDLVAPGKARMKMYMRCWGDSFDEIWDYYTLGGRIPELDDDKEKFRDLMNLLSGTTYETTAGKQNTTMDPSRYTSATKKLTAIYFSLSAENPTPAPKLCLYPSNFAPTDEVIVQGLDAWLKKYEWHDGGKTIEERVKSVLYVCRFLSCANTSTLLTRRTAHTESLRRRRASSRSLESVGRKIQPRRT